MKEDVTQDGDVARDAELLEHGVSTVLLDLSLRGIDGINAIEQVRSAAPEAPIVVLADHGDDRRALAAIRAGAQDYLVKGDISSVLLGRSMRHAIERKRLEVRLAHMALHDPLTGLPNRALFLDRLGLALDRSRRTNTRVGVMFLDVDRFKEINDSGGHDTGDTVLVGLADRLRAMLRPMDTVARFGGDEFTFLFEDLGSDREIVLIAERIRRAVARPIRLTDGEARITVSIGIATVVDPGVTPESVLRDADAAMYRTKERGRSRYELCDESSRQRALARLEITEDAVTRNPDLATRSLGALKDAGVEIAIDGYGTGATSLASLKRLPVDTLKIHESFVTGLGNHSEETSIVGAVVELGHAFGLHVSAEGVETDLQLAQLRSLGCDEAQGYLLGRPMPERGIEALLA